MTLDSRGYAALAPIYDAAVDHSQWQKALDAAVPAFAATAATLTAVERGGNPYNIQALGGAYKPLIPTGEIDYFVKHLSHLEAEQWEALTHQQARRLVLDDVMADADTLDARDDYRYLREKAGVRRRVAVRLNENPAWYDALTIGYDANLSAIPRAYLTRIETLLPHLAKAVEMGRAFAQLRARYSAVLAVLDRVHVGLAIATARGEVIVANSEADRILGLADGVSLSRDKHIVCRDPDQTEMLRAFICEAAQTAGGEANKPEGLIAVPRRSGAHPFLIEVAPLSDSMGEVDFGLVGALITLIDPGKTPDLDIQKFGGLHGLTRAETSVCGYMVAGLTGPGIAEHRGTSPETVKEQMRAILAKTGVARRSDLIRLVVRTLPPIG